MKRIKFVLTVIFLMLVLNTAGCVVETYRYDTINDPVRFVYIPDYRPNKLYHYNNFWYDEPYTEMMYVDLYNRISVKKIPNSRLPRPPVRRERISKPDRRLPKMPKKRELIRSRIRRRKREQK